MSAVVFGSINMDLVARVPRLPLPGETLTGTEFVTLPGGKGANQAVAIARLAVPVQLVGRVGADQFGDRLRQGLEENGVECTGVAIDASTSSGIALIAVDDRAENHIILIPGANGRVDETDIARLGQSLPHAQLLLLQLEIPLEAVVAAAQQARAIGVAVMLDPAPAPSTLPPDLYPLIDILTPNQVEVAQLVGFPVNDVPSAVRAATQLRQWGVEMVIVKLGSQGAICVSQEGTEIVPAFPVKAIDTVAAGDAFNGGLAAALTEGLSPSQALRWASATAALAVTKAGAQPSLPTRSQLAAFLEQH
ncbi:MAG: ribokinase [Leptolyngbyaceae cyanobacterium SL_7_1]|nr:ribokinase [Leptolyngbyaceae cyanobacterium SL_7_1]